jgi:hypothetical protein
MGGKDKLFRTLSPMRNLARQRRGNACGCALGLVPSGLAAVLSSLVVLATSAAAEDVGPVTSGPGVTVSVKDWRGACTLACKSGGRCD